MLIYAAINFYILRYANAYIAALPNTMVSYGMVLGASVQEGELSDVLQDRVDVALALYDQGTVFEKIFVSGDDTDERYKEVATVRLYLENNGVEPSMIVTDPYGLDTYDSMRRAKHLYNVDTVVIFTQGFHLARSVYIARRLWLEARWVPTDRHQYYDAKRFSIRESAARIKAFVEVEILDARPASREKVELP